MLGISAQFSLLYFLSSFIFFFLKKRKKKLHSQPPKPKSSTDNSGDHAPPPECYAIGCEKLRERHSSPCTCGASALAKGVCCKASRGFESPPPHSQFFKGCQRQVEQLRYRFSKFLLIACSLRKKKKRESPDTHTLFLSNTTTRLTNLL